jgi:L-lactate dehydrogenase complex protein LldG
VSARDEVLGRLRAQHLQQVDLPALEGGWVRYADPRERFREALGEAAGVVVSVGIGTTLQEVIAGLAEVRAARRWVSLSPVVTANGDAPELPHDFRDVDVVVVPARFGVAENGAVWIDGAAAPVRAALFLAQHLVVLLPQGEIVDNMHQAYERIGGTLADNAYGCFMCGPSKTADIEQALVVGAHGPRSLTVVEY